ncbi:MAG: S4 domain-containing protein [Acidobacteriota bacterium]
MRLDLFLKHARLIRRRSAAKAAALGGEVRVNGRPAKPGREVAPGDLLVLFSEEGAALEVEILAVPDRPVPKGRESEFYRIRRPSEASP